MSRLWIVSKHRGNRYPHHGGPVKNSYHGKIQRDSAGRIAIKIRGRFHDLRGQFGTPESIHAIEAYLLTLNHQLGPEQVSAAQPVPIRAPDRYRNSAAFSDPESDGPNRSGNVIVRITRISEGEPALTIRLAFDDRSPPRSIEWQATGAPGKHCDSESQAAAFGIPWSTALECNA